MLRNIGIWNSFNFNAKKVAHPLGERPGARGSGPIPFNLVPRDLEKLGEVDHSESNNENVKKKKRLISNATTLHMQHIVLSISLLLCDCSTTA